MTIYEPYFEVWLGYDPDIKWLQNGWKQTGHKKSQLENCSDCGYILLPYHECDKTTPEPTLKFLLTWEVWFWKRLVLQEPNNKHFLECLSEAQEYLVKA